MTEADLAQIVKAHAAWLRGEAEGARAYLSGADLSRANLSRAYLSGADLSGANLSGAYLSGANLSRAYLSGADLSRANLSRAYLSGANLSGADLSRANLSGAYLSGAYLSGADLSGAYLSGADLSGAYLSRAYLSRAKYDDKTIWAEFQIVPEAGPFWLWKKLREGIVAQLEVPAEAARVSSTSRKCRVEYATVLALFGADGVALAPDTVRLSTLSLALPAGPHTARMCIGPRSASPGARRYGLAAAAPTWTRAARPDRAWPATPHDARGAFPESPGSSRDSGRTARRSAPRRPRTARSR